MRLFNAAILISIVIVPLALMLYFNDYIRTNYYWILHLLFGFGAPWLISLVVVLLDKTTFSFKSGLLVDKSALSMKLGFVITVLVSLSNEYIMDRMDNINWIFIEQFIQTICDAIGMVLTFVLMRYLNRKDTYGVKRLTRANIWNDK